MHTCVLLSWDGLPVGSIIFATSTAATRINPWCHSCTIYLSPRHGGSCRFTCWWIGWFHHRNSYHVTILACIVRSISQETTTSMTFPAFSPSSASLLPTLQQLSMPVMTKMLGPVFRIAVIYSTPTATRWHQQQQNDEQDNDIHNIDIMMPTSVVSALQALQAWCTVSDLFIAQVQHWCTSKVKVGTGTECFCAFVCTVCLNGGLTLSTLQLLHCLHWQQIN